jgi:hypothetical protein
MCNIEMHLIIIEQAKLHTQIVSLPCYRTKGVSHCGLAIYIKRYLNAKEELYENSNISPCKNIIFQKLL